MAQIKCSRKVQNSIIISAVKGVRAGDYLLQLTRLHTTKKNILNCVVSNYVPQIVEI